MQQRLSAGEAGAVRPGESRLARAASKAAFGDLYDAQYKLEDADVILSLDADFLSAASLIRASCQLARDYAERRTLRSRQRR